MLTKLINFNTVFYHTFSLRGIKMNILTVRMLFIA
jgi:hypothetical protein